MRLIDADALYKSFGASGNCNNCPLDAYKCQYYNEHTLMEFCERIDDAPTVDPIKHGHWIIRDIPGTYFYQITCSECSEDVTSSAPYIGFLPNAKVLWDYCPYCGAEMDEVKKDGDT